MIFKIKAYSPFSDIFNLVMQLGHWDFKSKINPADLVFSVNIAFSLIRNISGIRGPKCSLYPLMSKVNEDKPNKIATV